jgi:superfamily I DNA and/or RNA helicase
MFFDKNDEISSAGEYFSCASKSKEISKQIANNAMLIANNASMIFLPYNDSKLDGDIWLKEHFRCKDEIIAISNEISYKNEIVQCSGKGGRLVFIESSGQKVDNINVKEANSIVEYLTENIDELCDFIGCESAELYKKIGIITPFLKQQLKITEIIDESRLGDIKVGTVHKFQGSERDIIIFSTVYGSNNKNPQNFFFNREDPDMINVAVTRAKKMFVCFGNQRLLSSGDTYSATMMRHILENGEIK